MPASYDLRIKRSAEREIRALTQQQRRRVVACVRSLAEEPRPSGCRKLAGRDAYRLRVGVLRVIYTIADDLLVVEVVHVAHRREAYR